MNKKYFAMSIIAVSVALSACSDDDDDDDDVDTNPIVTPMPPAVTAPAADTTDDSSAYDIIANSPDHTDLAALIVAADLADTLDDGDFTIFAPTNDALAALEAAPEGDALVRVLQYHVVAGTVLSTAISEGVTSATEEAPFTLDSLVMDAPLTFTNPEAGLSITDSAGATTAILTADLAPMGEGSTGVVHSIGAVLTPPEAPEVIDPPGGTPPAGGGTDPVVQGGAGTTLATAGNFSIFLNSLNGADGVSGPFPGSLDNNAWTFFAPTDEALAAAGITALTQAQLTAHISTNGALDEAALGALSTIQPANNVGYPVTSEGGVITVDGNTVTLTATGDMGGQIYAIDGVIGQ